MGNIKGVKEEFDTDFDIKHCVTNSWRMSAYHFHDVFEIYLAMCGGVKYFVGDMVYEVEKKDMLIFNSMDLHKTVVSPDLKYERFIVLFNPQIARELSTSKTNLLECFSQRGKDFCHKISLNNNEYNSYLQILYRAHSSLWGNAYGKDVYSRINLAEILLFVNNTYKHSSVQSRTCRCIKVKPILQYINSNLNKDLSLEKLSQKFFISIYHLGQTFKEATGFTINQYIINLRIMNSRRLLREDFSVTEACHKSGFNNVSHFIRTFKKLTGITPKQYSLKHRESN